jgi:steroid delta-isomerase-like uncharacterized protein
MSTEQNKEIVRRVYEDVINQERAELIEALYAADVVVHDPFMGEAHGVGAFRELLGMFDAAFPHHRVAIDAMVAEGDMVSVLHTHTATHGGTFMGMPATGKSVVVPGIELFRLRDGKIVEFWRKDDDVSLMVQLGMIPS